MNKRYRIYLFNKNKSWFFTYQSRNRMKIGSSKIVVNNFFNLNDNYGKRNSWVRPKALSFRKERTILRFVSTGRYSNVDIIKQTGLNVCWQTICNTIRRGNNLQYAVKPFKPLLLLLPLHKMQHFIRSRDNELWWWMVPGSFLCWKKKWI